MQGRCSMTTENQCFNLPSVVLIVALILPNVSLEKMSNCRQIKIGWSHAWHRKQALITSGADALKNVQTASICIRHGLIQFKHRLHYSKEKLAKIYPNVDSFCDRCRHLPANLAHTCSGSVLKYITVGNLFSKLHQMFLGMSYLPGLRWI